MERHSLRIVSGARNYAQTAFPQNFHTRKLGEITVFFTVKVDLIRKILCVIVKADLHDERFHLEKVLKNIFKFRSSCVVDPGRV